MRKISKLPGIEEVMNCFPFPAMLVDKNHRLITANRAAGDAVKSNKGPQIVKDCYKFSDEGIGRFPDCPLNHAIETGEEAEQTIRQKDGAWYRVSVYPTDIETDDGDRLYLHMLRDATETIQESMELEIRNALLDTSRDSIIMFNKDGVVVYANEEAASIRGFTMDELLGKDIFALNAPGEQSMISKRVDLLQKHGQAEYRCDHVRKDGSLFAVAVHARMVDIRGDSFILASMRDVSEIIEAERAFKESERRLLTLIGNLDGAVYRCANDADWTMQFVSEGILDLTGYKPDEMIGGRCISYGKLIMSEDREAVWEIVQAAVKKKKSFTLEYRIKTAKGEERWIWERGRGIFKDGKLEALEGFLSDATEMHRATEILEDQNKELALQNELLDQVADSIVINDKDTNTVYANKAAYETRGYTLEEILKLKIKDLDAPESVPHIKELFERSQKEDTTIIDSVHKRKDGTKFPVEIRTRKIKFLNKDCVLAVIRDMTQRREAEKLLEEQNAELAVRGELLDRVTDSIFIHDQEQNIMYANKPAYESRGYTEDEVYKIKISDIDAPHEVPNIEGRIEQLKRAKTIVFETYHRRKDGTEFPVEVRARAIKFKGRDCIIAACRDITSRRVFEDALKQERDTAQLYLDLVGVLVMALDSSGIVTMINKQGADMLGYSEDEVLGKNWFVEFVPADIRDEVKTVFNQIIVGDIKGVEWHENRVIVKDGTERMFTFHNRYVRDEKGAITGILSSGEDVTIFNTAKKAAEDSYRRMERIVEGIIVALGGIVETKDPYTAGHQARVSKLATAIATEMDLPAHEVRAIEMAASIHDIGKTYVPSEILNKPGKLNDLEFRLVKTHSETGYKILKGIDFDQPIAEIVLQHHERINGSGYPNGLKKDDILPGARIIAVADVIEAMAFDRPYRPELGLSVALAEIEKNMGVLYDKNAAAAALALFASDRFSF
jgi:PAS domain S-box-containing protein/putative nucleotidyltransferase with HDIG domain